MSLNRHLVGKKRLLPMVRIPDLSDRCTSLLIERASLPAELAVIAWTDEPGWDDEIQAVRHRTRPVWGVQFHPESIASEGGRTIVQNFLSLS